MAKVKIQGNASGTGVLTVTAPNTSTDRTITLPDGDVTLGAATPSITDNGNANAITIDSSENVGFGVTPETWDSRKALQIGGNGALAASPSAGSGGYIQLLQNAYTDGTWKYISTDEAARLRSQDGQWNFDVAASGSADSAISWATKVTIDNDGLKFGTDTAAANALDDYEEGTWTPSITFNQSSTGITHNIQNGKYVKIGSAVYVTCHCSLSSKGTASGVADINGLPFTINQQTGGAFAPIGDRGKLNTGGQPVNAYLAAGNTYARLYENGFDGTGNTTVTNTNFANDTDIDFNFVYYTDS